MTYLGSASPAWRWIKSFREKESGDKLLMAGANPCLAAASEAGGVVLVIDAKNEKAAAWYRTFGALPPPT